MRSRAEQKELRLHRMKLVGACSCGAVTVMRERLMVQTRVGGVVVVAAIAAMAGSVQAAPCGNTSAGFESWKRVFAQEAAGPRREAEGDLGADDHEILDRHHQGRPRPEELQAVARCLHGKARRGRHRFQGAAAEGGKCRALRQYREALRRAARTAARHLGHGDRVRRLHRKPEHAVGGRHACL